MVLAWGGKVVGGDGGWGSMLREAEQQDGVYVFFLSLLPVTLMAPRKM